MINFSAWLNKIKNLPDRVLTFTVTLLLRLYAWDLFLAICYAPWLSFAFRHIGFSLIMASTFICWPCVETACCALAMLTVLPSFFMQKDSTRWGLCGLISHFFSFISTLYHFRWHQHHLLGFWFLLSAIHTSAVPALASSFIAFLQPWMLSFLLFLSFYELSICAFTLLMQPMHKDQSSQQATCYLYLYFLTQAWLSRLQYQYPQLLVLAKVAEPLRLPIMATFVAYFPDEVIAHAEPVSAFEDRANTHSIMKG